MDLTVVSFADGGQSGGWVRRFQPQRPVRTMPVVVLDVNPERLLQMRSPNDQQPAQALGTDRANPAFGIGVRLGRLDAAVASGQPAAAEAVTVVWCQIAMASSANATGSRRFTGSSTASS
jgi:hypothetical protein